MRQGQYDPHNGRTVRLSGDLTNCTANEDEHGDIIELICVYDDCDFTIKLGDTIRPTPKSPHRVNHIVPGYHDSRLVCYDLINCHINTSSIFALPSWVGTESYSCGTGYL